MAAALRSFAAIASAAPLKGLRPLSCQIKLINTIAVGNSNGSNARVVLPFVKSFQNEEIKANERSTLHFSPNSISNFEEPLNRTRLPIMDMPRLRITTILPKIISVPVLDKTIDNFIDCPTNDDKTEKQAERLIVIRRKKMRVHKLRKLRKRMKYEWAKVKQRREIKKEKIFQSKMMIKLKEAQAWSAESYVSRKLKAAKANPIPKSWGGKRYPEFYIKQLMGIDKRVEYKQFKSFNKS
ncbi:uncharacterized protein LOC143914022 [Arctopsyche grandis]|uniref:uncharacterized protein LOC143914022 n=1 Tax=Arctopsyche grandis TaxID=121162 RepID=UPI00406D9A6D